jgi:hypothetical protein
MNYKQMAKDRIKKIANNKLNKRIQKLKDIVKKEKEYIDKCKEYNKSINFIDDVNISFDPELDVSAKTVNGEIFLNKKLYNRPIEDQVRYALHELVHCLQQEAGLVDSKKTDDYLDDENEIEAFNVQINYMKNYESPEEIQEYLEGLFNRHELPEEERQEKTKELVKDE